MLYNMQIITYFWNVNSLRTLNGKFKHSHPFRNSWVSKFAKELSRVSNMLTMAHNLFHDFMLEILCKYQSNIHSTRILGEKATLFFLWQLLTLIQSGTYWCSQLFSVEWKFGKYPRYWQQSTISLDIFRNLWKALFKEEEWKCDHQSEALNQGWFHNPSKPLPLPTVLHVKVLTSWTHKLPFPVSSGHSSPLHTLELFSKSFLILRYFPLPTIPTFLLIWITEYNNRYFS